MTKTKLLTTAVVVGMLVSSHTGYAADLSDKVTRGEFISQVVDGDYKKILKGYPDGNYRLDAPITREQAAIVISSVLRQKGIDQTPLNHYLDLTNAPYWAMADVQFAADMGFLKVNSRGRLMPGECLTKDELSYIVEKLHNM